MKTEITTIEHISHECVKITALVYWRGLPRPHYEDNETDAQYSKRVLPIAKELESYTNLHIGRAELVQKVDRVTIPKVAEYDT